MILALVLFLVWLEFFGTSGVHIWFKLYQSSAAKRPKLAECENTK